MRAEIYIPSYAEDADIIPDLGQAIYVPAYDRVIIGNGVDIVYDLIKKQPASTEPVTEVSGVTDYDVLLDDSIIYVDTSVSGSVALNLLPCTSGVLKAIRIFKVDNASGQVNITPNGSDTINGLPDIINITTQWHGYQLQNNGADGWVATYLRPDAGGGSGSGDVTGPASSTNNNVAFFSGSTGKVIKDMSITLSGSNTGDETSGTIITKLGYTPVPPTRTINGLDLSANRTLILKDINVLALAFNPTDAQTIYFGNNPKAPTTNVGQNKIYFRETCTITSAEVYTFASTAGTNESWSLYIRLNNTTDTLVATVSASAQERVFSNTGLSIAIASGDYIEFKFVNPTWATNPLTVTIGGYFCISN